MFTCVLTQCIRVSTLLTYIHTNHYSPLHSVSRLFIYIVLFLNIFGEDAMKFDIIVSNPPYVRNLEKAEMRKNVLEYEPETALFVEDHNPLIFYDKIADLAKATLTVNGSLYFEINQYLGKETVGLLQDLGFSQVELRKDLSGNDRMIKAIIKK